MKSRPSFHHRHRFLMIAVAVSLMLTVSVANAQNYLVELIIFSHAGGQPDGYRTTELNDFSERLDPLRLAEAERAAIQAAEEFRRLSSNPQTAAPEFAELPEPYLALADLSDTMQDAFNRLDRSGRYRVLTSRAWIQPAERRQRTRWLRLHDEQTIDWAGPKADAGLPALDEAVVHYRLDGQTRLRRTQFLNLALNLEWRQTAGRPAPILPPGSPADAAQIRAEISEQPQVWRVHRLEQSRAVRVDRLEYFDSEWLGVLALISLVEPPSEPEASELESDAGLEPAEQRVGSAE